MGDPEDPSNTTTDAQAAARAPTRIGVYRVLGPLGAGGMGEVVLAFDDRLQRRVAIKRIRGAATASEQARERLRREAAAAATLNHPAIVHIYDILAEPAGEAIVMEYVEGQTLAQMRAKGPLSPRQAAGLARQVAEGLAAAHAVGLIHRDLKTQNVMVTASGQAKILDFGVAKHLTHALDDDSLTAEGALLGTLRSMSPEQAEGRALDARSDLFSLGVLLYEICTGRPPFQGDSPARTLLKVIGEKPAALGDLNPELPAPLRALIEALLEKDPERRPPSAAVVAERLAEIEVLPALSLTATAVHARGLAGGRRSTWRWPLVAAVGLAAAGALAVALVRNGRAPERSVAVLVMEPKPPSTADESSRFAAFAVRASIVRTLTALDGIEPVGPRDVPEGATSVPDAARATAADEVVVPSLTCEGPSCFVSLRRQGAGARVIRESRPFEVPIGPEGSLTLARAVAVNVRDLFADHGPRSARERLEIQDADYQRWLLLRRRQEAGEMLGRPELAELEEIARSSPDLAEASLMAASTARTLGDRPRAQAILQQAAARHPDDPRVATERFSLELEAGNLAGARAALADLERLAPGDLRVLRARGDLLVLEGKRDEAADVLRRMVLARPSWRNLWYVARLEMDLGDKEGARQHLQALLQVSPGNVWGLGQMAEYHWRMGDPKEAIPIYEGLLQKSNTRQYLSNLGWSRLLAGQYAASAETYRRILEREPNHFLSLLNLGIAEQGAGDMDGARRRYRDLLQRMPPPDNLTAMEDKLIRAQALARLDRPMEAVALTFEALGKGDHTPDVLFEAALIYALCGDHNTALLHARKARERGLSPYWLRVPGFESLSALPAFRALRDG